MWFDCTEPSLCTLLQGKQGVQGAYALVWGGSSTSNLIEPPRTTTSLRGIHCVQGAKCTSSGTSNLLELHPHRASKVARHLSHELGVVRPRTISFREIARCVEVYHMSSGWFDRVLLMH